MGKIQKVEEAYIEKDEEIKWLDKKALLGQTRDFVIDDVLKLDNDMILSLIDCENEATKGQYLRISSTVKNDLIETLGNDPRKWVGTNIRLSFEQFKPKEGQKNVSEGVRVILEKTVEEVDTTA